MVWMNKLVHCFIYNKNTGQHNQRSFNGCRKKFSLTMAMGMVCISWFVCDGQTVESNQTSDYIHDTFQRISQNALSGSDTRQ
jgi:hypothetical protein